MHTRPVTRAGHLLVVLLAAVGLVAGGSPALAAPQLPDPLCAGLADARGEV